MASNSTLLNKNQHPYPFLFDRLDLDMYEERTWEIFNQNVLLTSGENQMAIFISKEEKFHMYLYAQNSDR